MISIDRIRNNFEEIKSGLLSKGYTDDLGEIISIDKDYRHGLHRVNELRAERNKVSDEIAELKKTKQNANEKIILMRTVGQKIKNLESSLAEQKENLNNLILNLPNIPNSSVPKGSSEVENKIISEWGNENIKSFDLKTHIDLGSSLKLFDFERSAKLSGSGFPLYTGKGALIERSLINFMIEFQTQKNDYLEIIPPFLVNSNSVLTTGNLPKFSDDMYHSEIDNLWLIPTAEVPLTNIHCNEILNESDLPKKYAAYSACFRREAGSYGKDTKGLKRLHQFNKVELVQLVKPEESYEALESLTLHAEMVLQALNLKYRKIELCTGDLSFSAAKCYDLEIWAPAEEKWLEVSSCSNFEDFQSRRGNIRFRKEDDNKVDFVHTLNGSGLATPRLLIALLETYQNADGTVTVPEILQDYAKLKIID
ncbi:MAG: serine--tRNA ligase [Candidatus Neomarinimicrobiota bacterium]|nr:MAG: serine--tRNA ligase [bacterium]|tara:strand:+ start:465 stop:1733 length:1269 start_codon:yes stop_codon:yes gene_type:complete